MSRNEGNGRVSFDSVIATGTAKNARFEYLWQDSENFKRPTKMPAPEYVEHLMAWVQGNVDNESMFPSRIGTYCYLNFNYTFVCLLNLR